MVPPGPPVPRPSPSHSTPGLPSPPPLGLVGVGRLHWLTGLFRAWRIVVIFVAMLGAAVMDYTGLAGLGLSVLLVSVLALFVGFLTWWMVRYRFDGDDLVLETGLLRWHSRQIPLARLQAVDLVRPAVARLFGLAELRLKVAGDDRAEAPFRYLRRSGAQGLRAELLARAAGLDARTPEAPERVLYRLPPSVLFGSLIFRLPVMAGGILFCSLLALGIIGAEPGVLGGAVPLLLGLLRAVASPLVTYWNFTIAHSPDGLRLRYGLMETRMQTVPPGRIQALRISEPLLWRSLDWARVEVNVAGYVGERTLLASVLLPAAPKELAHRIVSVVFPGVRLEATRLLAAPGRSGIAAPLRGNACAAGTDDVVFVTRRGVICRETDVIAHVRAQSVRLTAGPWQRLFGLATVHVDSSPGPVHVTAPHRYAEEARAIVESEAERARRARASAPSDRWMVTPRG
ncbi:MAG: PH domain-containing protein [Streptosporangiales bacterium]|nr:PH domain-containing protein [Streptosporangiales bacterium]